jgi:hypothetical protein
MLLRLVQFKEWALGRTGSSVNSCYPELLKESIPCLSTQNVEIFEKY